MKHLAYLLQQWMRRLAKAATEKQVEQRIDRWIATAFPGWGARRLEWRLWNERRRKALEDRISVRGTRR